MGLASTYLSAVAAGALTAGVAASNVVAVPPETFESPDVALAAQITIPILDIEPSPGPITITRQILLTLGAVPNELFGRLDTVAGTAYDLPGLNTDFTSSGQQNLFAKRTPGESIEFGFDSAGPESGEWSILDGFAEGITDIQRSRALSLTALTGGAGGIGAALGGTLANSGVQRSVSVLDSGFTTASTRQVGVFDGELAFMPFDGFKAVGGGTLVNTDGKTGLKLGSLQVGGGGNGTLGGDAGLCLGSAQASCDDKLAFASLAAPVNFGVQIGDPTTDDFRVNLPNNLAVAVGDGRFSVEGDIGGEVSVGSLTLGRIRHIDIQIPSASSMMSTNNNRQQQTIRDSLRAIPRNLASDNDATGGRHRAPLREAIADAKTAVDNAVNGKHAKEATED
jgi:hypothetical protein